jgi:hypothetical protein
MVKIQVRVAVLAASLVASAAPAATYLGPSEYRAFAEGDFRSPFATESFTSFWLEDFEDGTLNTPGVSIREIANTSIQTSYSDSVDADDGFIDGRATGNARSLFSAYTTTSFTFVFSAAELGGRLPTHAGIVWTDVGRNGGGTPLARDLIENTYFEAFGSTGDSLGIIGPFLLGDTSISRTAAEDRFFGVIDLAGISAIRISMPGLTNWEVDHLQYGVSPIPEPGTALLLGVGVLSLLAATRTRRCV